AGDKFDGAADGRAIEFVTSLLNPAHFALHLEF
ncbi:GntR family transcriptional regulator, partial [Mesorhizobium sp. M5C.F.Ca.IN.020.29.1.1]